MADSEGATQEQLASTTCGPKGVSYQSSAVRHQGCKLGVIHNLHLRPAAGLAAQKGPELTFSGVGRLLGIVGPCQGDENMLQRGL